MTSFKCCLNVTQLFVHVVGCVCVCVLYVVRVVLC